MVYIWPYVHIFPLWANCIVGYAWLMYSLCMTHVWPMYDLYMVHMSHMFIYAKFNIFTITAVFEHAHVFLKKPELTMAAPCKLPL